MSDNTSWRGTPTLPMGSTSSLDPVAGPFESGMLRLVLQLASLQRSTLAIHAQPSPPHLLAQPRPLGKTPSSCHILCHLTTTTATTTTLAGALPISTVPRSVHYYSARFPAPTSPEGSVSTLYVPLLLVLRSPHRAAGSRWPSQIA
jgi:hypothetical protein